MKEPKQGTVDGVTYNFMPLPPGIAMKLLARISKSFLGPLGALFSNQVLDANKTSLQYDLYFTEKGPVHLLKVAYKSFEVNYGDFLSVLKEGMQNTTSD